MLKKFMFLAVILILSSLVVAQTMTQSEYLAAVPSHSSEATITCSATYSSGTGQNATKFCVTVNGNIPQFSIGGQEMIDVGAVLEGYGVCDLYSGVAYYDYALEDSGNWQPSTFAQSGNTVTVSRLTSDGIWQLKQVITNVPATNLDPGFARVSMTLKNFSDIPRPVYVVRYADIDANSTFFNDFDYTSQTAFGLDPAWNRGLSITNNTFNPSITQFPYIQNTFIYPDACNPLGNLAPQPFTGDGSVGIFWNFSAAHGVTNTVISSYKPI